MKFTLGLISMIFGASVLGWVAALTVTGHGNEPTDQTSYYIDGKLYPASSTEPCEAYEVFEFEGKTYIRKTCEIND